MPFLTGLEDSNIICGKGRNRKFIATEDIRNIPINILPQDVQRAELGIQPLISLNEETKKIDGQIVARRRIRFADDSYSSAEEDDGNKEIYTGMYLVEQIS